MDGCMSEQDEMPSLHILTHTHTHTLPKADKAEQCPLKALATDHNINTILRYTVQCGRVSLENNLFSTLSSVMSCTISPSKKMYFGNVQK